MSKVEDTALVLLPTLFHPIEWKMSTRQNSSRQQQNQKTCNFSVLFRIIYKRPIPRSSGGKGEAIDWDASESTYRQVARCLIVSAMDSSKALVRVMLWEIDIFDQ